VPSTKCGEVPPDNSSLEVERGMWLCKDLTRYLRWKSTLTRCVLVVPTVLEPAGIETRTRFVGMPTLRTDVQKLRQALLNLVRNAAEAMPKGGTLTLSSREPVVADGRKFVQISVEDTGPGLPEEILLNLFEPVIALKEPEGSGTQASGLLKLFKPVRSSKGAGHAGLGLSIVGSLVEELGGRIQCATGPEGTSFHILLPQESPKTTPPF
jgi:signal transduction histidine kinase